VGLTCSFAFFATSAVKSLAFITEKNRKTLTAKNAKNFREVRRENLGRYLGDHPVAFNREMLDTPPHHFRVKGEEI
jgi:hypothetical protein